MTLQKGICEECRKEYEYEYNPKYPRKYCHECSAKKKAEFTGQQPEEKVEVVRPGEPVKANVPPYNKNTTMYVSYAKDIFCALIQHDEYASKGQQSAVMNVAIELVKQARDSF